MPPRKLKRSKKRKAKEVDPAKALATRLKREESLRKRELMVEKMSAIFTRRSAEREAKRNAIRDERIKAYQTEVRNRAKTDQEKKMIQIRSDMKSIIVAGVEKVNACRVIGERVKLEGSTMRISGSKYKLKNNVHMVGWGRETLMLGAAFEKVIGKHMKKGFLVVPRGSMFGMWDTPLWFPALNTRISYFEAGTRGLPDKDSVEATRRIADYCRKLRKSDILVVVLSGGTEDLLFCPRGAITLDEFVDVLSRLKSAGATPAEIAIVKTKLSIVFGGELARLAYPAKVITLAMSEVPENPAHLIAGGPTVNNPKRDAAFFVLKKYGMDMESLPPSVNEVLQERQSLAKDPLLDEDNNFKFVDYHVVASAEDAVQGMTDAAFRLGLVPLILSSTVAGTVREVSQAYSQIAKLMILAAEGKISKLDMYDAMKFDPVLPLSADKVREIFPSKEKWGLGLCLLLGGAPGVEFNGDNATGPNQELALYFSLDWYLKVKEYPILNEYVVWFLGGSTSGIDGNSRVAGAYGYGNLGPGIFKYFKKLTDDEVALGHEVRGLVRSDPDSEETREAVERHNALRDEIARVSVVLPDRVLKDHNANFMFMNINDGDELLNLGYTYTSVGDLHVIRIAKYQCNCDGNCLGAGAEQPLEGVCRDERCAVNGEDRPVIAAQPKPKGQCCGRLARPKIKIY